MPPNNPAVDNTIHSAPAMTLTYQPRKVSVLSITEDELDLILETGLINTVSIAASSIFIGIFSTAFTTLVTVANLPELTTRILVDVSIMSFVLGARKWPKVS